MANITTDEVARLAHLARIALTTAETRRLATELSTVLGYIEKLKKVDTSGVEITSQVTGLKSIWRTDVIKPSLPREQVLENAPGSKEGYIKVKKVL